MDLSNQFEIICKDCNVPKLNLEFHKDSSYSNGYTRVCKTCKKLRQVNYYNSNKETIAVKTREYEIKNAEKISKRKKEYRLNNLQYVTTRNSNWKKLNRDKVAANRAKYRAVQKRATPKWLTKNQLLEIYNFYSQAQQLSKTTGIKHHVDHIEPLNGETSIGLHVPWNLRVIPHFENESKGNKIIN